ncbi:hypothetical protein MG295_00128 [Bacillus phage vB_BcgM]|nr:hypothetical protein MG295_00128 [Bacillus phage vB_BcgM]
MNEGKWVLEYYRYYSKYTQVTDTKEEALAYGCNREDNGEISMSCLYNPQGEVDMDDRALSNYYCREW